MTAEVENILRCFELLAEADKGELASEILRHTLKLHVPAFSDEQFAALAEDVLLELDLSENGDA